MTHIFICYSRKNRRKVHELVARLQVDGFDVWLDRQAIDGGDQWREKIVVAMNHAYTFLLALLPASVVSNDVWKEADLSEDSKRRIIPLSSRASVFRLHFGIN